jgi:hypothetical protein
MSSAIVNELQKATDGLIYASESDEPFQAFLWKNGSGSLPQRLLELSGHKHGTRIEEVTLDDFFADLTADQDWYGQTEKETAESYRRLLQTLKTHLFDIRVFRVGQVNIDIYIMGRTSSGDWAGIKTQAVET